MCSVGLTGSLFGYFSYSLSQITFGAHTMLGSSLLIVSGFQAILMHMLSLDLSKNLDLETQKKLQFLIDFYFLKLEKSVFSFY